MKIKRVKPVGTRDGETLYRVKIVTDSGERHRLLCKASDLSHPRRLNNLAEARLGKRLVSDSLPPGELSRAVSMALVPAGPRHASFDVSWPAGHRDERTGLPSTTGVSEPAAVLRLIGLLLEQLQKVTAITPPPDDLLDRVSDVLQDTVQALEELDDNE